MSLTRAELAEQAFQFMIIVEAIRPEFETAFNEASESNRGFRRHPATNPALKQWEEHSAVSQLSALREQCPHIFASHGSSEHIAYPGGGTRTNCIICGEGDGRIYLRGWRTAPILN